MTMPTPLPLLLFLGCRTPVPPSPATATATATATAPTTGPSTPASPPGDASIVLGSSCVFDTEPDVPPVSDIPVLEVPLPGLETSLSPVHAEGWQRPYRRECVCDPFGEPLPFKIAGLVNDTGAHQVVELFSEDLSYDPNAYFYVFDTPPGSFDSGHMDQCVPTEGWGADMGGGVSTGPIVAAAGREFTMALSDTTTSVLVRTWGPDRFDGVPSLGPSLTGQLFAEMGRAGEGVEVDWYRLFNQYDPYPVLLWTVDLVPESPVHTRMWVCPGVEPCEPQEALAVFDEECASVDCAPAFLLESGFVGRLAVETTATEDSFYEVQSQRQGDPGPHEPDNHPHQASTLSPDQDVQGALETFDQDFFELTPQLSGVHTIEVTRSMTSTSMPTTWLSICALPIEPCPYLSPPNYVNETVELDGLPAELPVELDGDETYWIKIAGDVGPYQVRVSAP